MKTIALKWEEIFRIRSFLFMDSYLPLWLCDLCSYKALFNSSIFGIFLVVNIVKKTKYFYFMRMKQSSSLE